MFVQTGGDCKAEDEAAEAAVRAVDELREFTEFEECIAKLAAWVPVVEKDMEKIMRQRAEVRKQCGQSN